LSIAIAGQGGIVLLSGEAGIGKTSLARKLAREAASLGVCVLAGNCYDLTNTPPYGPWLDLLADYRPDGDLPPPPATVAGGVLARVTDQAALFAEFRRFFEELGETRPALIVLEDLHWADAASVELLRHVAPHFRRWPILLLITYRVDELTRTHPLYRQLPALMRDTDGLRLDLKRLDPPALRTLVAARYDLAEADEARLTTYLAHHAEGNPFFATEILRAVEEEGQLAQTTGRWALGELDRVAVPSLVRQVVDERIARLGETTRRLLAIAAVIGQEIPLALWARLAEVDEDALLTVVEHASAAHVLEAPRDGESVRFVHAITREVMYESILPPRRRNWHRRVAEALMVDARPDPDAVAYHLQQADDPRAWEWLERAGERAQRAYAWLTAVDRFRAAADLLVDVDGAERARSRILYRVTRLARFSYPAAAIGDVDEVARLAARMGDAVLAAETSYHRGVL
jgi:predicted ATPase